MTTDPFALFDTWLDEAAASEPNDPNAMALATADAGGRPSVREVLLKGHGPDLGFVFYTNRESRKGTDLAANPQAALLFHWKGLRRQVRIEGAVVQASDAESDVYFASRPRDSQLGAWASHQSAPIASRAALLQQLTEVTQRFADLDEVPVPPNWGGYLISAEVVEFWQGRENRVHNRIRVVTDAELPITMHNSRIERLQP